MFVSLADGGGKEELAVNRANPVNMAAAPTTLPSKKKRNDNVPVEQRGFCAMGAG